MNISYCTKCKKNTQHYIDNVYYIDDTNCCSICTTPNINNG